MPLYQCTDCDRSFTRRDNYRRHHRTRHRGELAFSQRAVCGRCWAIFIWHDTCQRHVASCHSRHGHTNIHTYYQMPRIEWPDFERANLAADYRWFDIPENMDVATQEFRDWALHYSDPSNTLLPRTLQQVTRNLATSQTSADTTQVIRYSDDTLINTNNTNKIGRAHV
jgi:hypothetical protein